MAATEFDRRSAPARRERLRQWLPVRAVWALGALLFRIQPLSLAGALVSGLALWALLPVLNEAFSYFDEGLVLTNAHLIRMGGLPYRDYYTNYGPGSFFFTAGLWSVVGISRLAVALRIWTILIHTVIALMAGRLAGRIVGRRFSFIACGLVSAWMVCLGGSPYAWLIGLMLALVAVNALATAATRPTVARFLSAGLAFGLLGTVRHDLLVYFGLIFGCSWALPGWAYRRLGLPIPPRRWLGWLALGAAAVLLPAWLPLMIEAGWRRVVDDLFFTQVRYVMPARVLPLPKLLARTPTNQYVFWKSPFEGAVILTFMGPALAALLLAWRRTVRTGLSGPVIVGLGCLTIAVLPQMTGRTDWIHAVFTVAPSLTLFAALLELGVRRYSWSWLVKMPLVLGLVAVVLESNWHQLWPLRRGSPAYIMRTSYYARPGFYEPDDNIATARMAVLDFIAHNSGPEDAIFVGTPRHDRVHANETDLYFLANRRAGTRYTQFDPNVVTREQVQREMIASLERNRVRILVLSSRWVGGDTPRDSEDHHDYERGLLPGSTSFDEYIQLHFKVAASHPPYELHTRID